MRIAGQFQQFQIQKARRNFVPEGVQNHNIKSGYIHTIKHSLLLPLVATNESLLAL